MKLGFTGTRRRGLTESEKGCLRELLPQVTEFHHGDCIGADKDAAVLALEYGVYVVVHPPNDPKLRAWAGCHESRAPKPYLKRNHDIVDETDVLAAAPYGPEVLRSGTWATVRYARKQKKTIIFLN